MSTPSREVDLGLWTMSKPFVVDIGFDIERSMPKASRDQPRVLIDDYIGWEGVGVERWYIVAALGPEDPKNPYAFPKAINRLGVNKEGFAGSMRSPQATFIQRYRRFFHFINDLLVSYGVSLYLTGNTITVVGKPQLDLVTEKVIDCAKCCIVFFLVEKRCIVKDDVLLKKEGRKKKENKKKGSKNKVSNEQALPLSSSTQDEKEQDEREQEEWGKNKVSNEKALPLSTAI
ncbi:hypothetical protein ACLB2K_074504 [Fragaria x ananassa]